MRAAQPPGHCESASAVFASRWNTPPIGMLISDLNGNWTYTNIALQQMLGYTARRIRALPPGERC